MYLIGRFGLKLANCACQQCRHNKFCSKLIDLKPFGRMFLILQRVLSFDKLSIGIIWGGGGGGAPRCFLSYKHLNLKLRVFLTGNAVAMVTSIVKKITRTCLPISRARRQFQIVKDKS